MSDAGNFHLMERIGPGTNNDIPVGLVLVADKGYGDIPPLLTPFRQTQITRMNSLINTKHAASTENYQSAVCWWNIQLSI